MEVKNKTITDSVFRLFYEEIVSHFNMHSVNAIHLSSFFERYIGEFVNLLNQSISIRVRYNQLSQVKLIFDEISRIGVDNTYDGLIW